MKINLNLMANLSLYNLRFFGKIEKKMIYQYSFSVYKVGFPGVLLPGLVYAIKQVLSQLSPRLPTMIALILFVEQCYVFSSVFRH